MRIVVAGGTGLIGSALVESLRARGHEAVPASPSTGVDTVTGAGLAEVLAGASVLVDVTNSPSFEAGPVLEFFTRSTEQLLAAGRQAGIRHHVVLSIVGTDGVPDSGYLRAKAAQEALVRAGGLPYSVVRATQFFEFLGPIAAGSTVDGVVRLPTADLQPVAAADVSAILAETVVAEPRNGRVDVAGPQRGSFADFVRPVLAAQGDPRTVVAGDDTPYFGAVLEKSALVPAGEAVIGATDFATWLAGLASDPVEGSAGRAVLR
ncbi:SDR family oxidoreductase [Pseudonocardia sp. WMMC193]|uniref:SDR family oxidoreductase n=1 Tax=Pseudonocardia sp. WMMC193 TaxID=2911965 RepID=UPI001F37AE68|nr:SDR family oxidoreductase [Pseudonocardia sp. WMMC193]MCF7547958.1 SDR family oxidoreductase [Pseudonocardia sp. WMMC193]